jgi:hypothetical protein
MKTIFRYANVGLLAGAIFAAGAVSTFAQDACADADGMTKLGDQFRAEFAAGKDVPNRKKAVATGKAFLDKYGSCEPAKDLATYLQKQIPAMEKFIRDEEERVAKLEKLNRFDTAWKAKNWDATFATGKEILAAYPDEYRTVEIALATVGGEEAFKANYKYNDDAIRLAKQSIADIEGGKSFKVGDKEAYGLFELAFKNKDEAIAWLNLYLGFMIQNGQKNKAAAAPYLYKATQSSIPEVSKNPVPYALIGDYYFEELNKVVDQIQAKAKEQKDDDPADVAQKKVDEIKALVAMSNGISERAMDAFSRAFTYGKDAAYKAKMKKNVADAYKVRFAKDTGVDEWITSAVAKPFVNPTTPVTPISDPEPAKTTTGTTATPAPATSPAPAKPASTIKPKNR